MSTPSPESSEPATNILSMNYDNCLLRSPVNEDTDTFALSRPNHINKLIPVAWFYDLTKEPLITQWDKSLTEGMVWALQYIHTH